MSTATQWSRLLSGPQVDGQSLDSAVSQGEVDPADPGHSTGASRRWSQQCGAIDTPDG
jgi:hypothetical protein